MRTKSGTVSSAKMDKTIVVTVHTYKQHPKYKKRYRTSKKFYAHDDANTCKEGDEVVIAEALPMSKTKRWKVIEVNGKELSATAPKKEAPTEQ